MLQRHDATRRIGEVVYGSRGAASQVVSVAMRNPAIKYHRDLRGRQHALTTEAMAALCRTVQEAFVPGGNPVRWGELAIAVETAIVLSNPLHSELMKRTIEAIDSGGPLRELAPLVFVLSACPIWP